MTFLNVTDKELIVRALSEVGVCERCCQRFVGEKGILAYKQPVSTMDEESTGKKCRPNACAACLGALQDIYMVEKLEDVVEVIKTSGYDSTRFSLSLSLPICLTLRQHSLWVYLTSRLPSSVLTGIDQRDVVPIKQVWKYIYPDLVANRVSLDHETGDITDFFVELNLDWPEESTELKSMIKICENEYKLRAKNIHVYNMGVFSRLGVEKSLSDVTSEQFSTHYPVPPKIPDESFGLSVKMFRSSVYLGGRYCKYSRELPQTPWLINGVRKCETSTEEVIAERLQERLGATELKFLASGREDVDVRMLGTGRPFAFECINTKKTALSAEEFKDLERYINAHHSGIKVNSLKFVTKNEIKKLKEGEEEKRKRYTALCVTDRPVDPSKLASLSSMGELTLQQETPIRVLHRRSNATRTKVVHSMTVNTDGMKGNMFKLEVTTSAGTYVKELVHGDFQRTQPNIGTLLNCNTDILALDVEEVGLDWPPNM